MFQVSHYTGHARVFLHDVHCYCLEPICNLLLWNLLLTGIELKISCYDTVLPIIYFFELQAYSQVGLISLLAYLGWILAQTTKLGRQFWSIRKVARWLDSTAILFNQSFFWAVEMIILWVFSFNAISFGFLFIVGLFPCEYPGVIWFCFLLILKNF